MGVASRVSVENSLRISDNFILVFFDIVLISMQSLEGNSHRNADLILLFESLFKDSENTILLDAGDEPIYLPADSDCRHHRIIFAHGFFSSALHEIAHWLIAGKQRRQLQDYGYWYNPDGRDEKQQLLFEQVEAKPQAIEWMLHRACGKKFHLSFDNLSLPEMQKQQFAGAVYNNVQLLLQHGVNQRTELLIQSLSNFYKQHSVFSASSYQLTHL